MGLGGFFNQLPRLRAFVWLLPCAGLLASCSLNPKIFHTNGSQAQVVSPNVSSVSPTAASTFGGATLTVSGSGFQPTTTVTLADGQACLNVRVQTATTLQCVLPPHAAGDINLIVATPGAGAQSTVPYSFKSDLFTQVDHVAGSYTVGGSYVEGTGKTARLYKVAQFTSDGTYLYAGIGDVGNGRHVITRIHIGSGQVSTYAGDPLDASGGTGDGPVATAQFMAFGGLTRIGRALYTTDEESCTMRKIDLDAGQVTTIAGQAGNCTLATDGDGPTTAILKRPGQMTTDGQVIYFIDSLTVRKYDPITHAVTTIAGTPAVAAGMVDGPPGVARIHSPSGLVWAAGRLYLSDSDCVREINPTTGEINAFAGLCMPNSSGEGAADGIGPSARFEWPDAMTSDGTDIYVADTYNHTVRKIKTSNGEVSTIAGNASVGVPGTNDGPIGVALLSFPHQIVYDPVAGLLVSSGVGGSEYDQTAVRKIH